ncbi:MAG TPA: hypothetical protein EYQ08_02055 [Planctomycetes bacterium]|nr:hypothetical protein [Planctomycetota bacterium]HIK82929.1 hypothetical protein [Planctomycetota bacterium]
MTSNRFRLGSLLRIRQQDADLHLQEMACCIERLENQRQQIKATEGEYRELVSQLRNSDRRTGSEVSGVTGQELLVHRRYLERLREQANAQTRIAQEMSDRLDTVRSEVEQALNRCRIIEQLKARRESMERDRNIRTVQKQLDDQNTTRFAGEIQSDSA